MSDSAIPDVVPNNQLPDTLNVAQNEPVISTDPIEASQRQALPQNATTQQQQEQQQQQASLGQQQPQQSAEATQQPAAFAQAPPPPPVAAAAGVQIDVNQIANVISVSYLAANGLNNQRNRPPGAAGVNIGMAGPGQNNIMNMRNRLFHAIYFKVALIYAQMFPKPFQRTLEYFFLIKALLFFSALVYIHMSFIKNPATCLEHVQDWPRDGVLRVEVIPNLDKRLEMYEKHQAHENSMRSLYYDYFYGIGPKTKNQLYHHKYATNETFTYYLQHEDNFAAYIKETKQQNTEYNENGDIDEEEQYIVEYSLEYGHLRLSPATRKRLQIPVRVVQLDPMNNQCFGDKFSKFLLKELLGYDDLLMASVRVIAEKEENKGYLRNVITGEHYRFVSTWWTAWSSYPTAFFVMLLFTFSISMLLRFSHHQIFVFIVDLLQMLEFNVTARFPIAPLLIVILALVGMEAIMSEFFNDTTTAFYIILIVWVADQYDAICCHTTITKRHWLRFFFLYHFAFYAYHYRFSGQNRSLALVSSWLFIQHSMLYFFHHYELPVIMQQAQVLILNRNQNDGNGGGGGGVVGGNIVAGIMQQQQQQPGQINRNGGVGGQQQGTLVGNRVFRLVPLPQQQQQQHQHGGYHQQQQQQQQQQHYVAQGEVLQNQPQQLPFVGGLLQHYAGQNVGGALGMIRRALFARGWRQPIRVRIQTAGNLQRINLGSIQINPENLARASPTTPTVDNNNTGSTTTTTTTAATTTTTTTPSNAPLANTIVITGSNGLTSSSSSSSTAGHGVNSTDVVTNQRDEYTNPTSANKTTRMTVQETETLGNTLTENKGVQQQQQQQQEQQIEENPVTRKNNIEDNVATTASNFQQDIRVGAAIVAGGGSGLGDPTLEGGINTMEIVKNNSVENMIVTTANKNNDNDNKNNEPEEMANYQQQHEHELQHLSKELQNEQQQKIAAKQTNHKDLSALENVETMEARRQYDTNVDKNVNGYLLSTNTVATDGPGNKPLQQTKITTEAIDHNAATTTTTLAASSLSPSSSISTAIQQEETIQIYTMPEMIDDETTNKPVTTTSTFSTEMHNYTPNNNNCTATVTPLTLDEVNNASSSSSSSISSINNSTSLSTDISGVERFTIGTTATTASNITRDNHNQSLNLTANASSTTSTPTPSNPTNTTATQICMTSDVQSAT